MAIKVVTAKEPEELDAVFKLRHQVFVEQDKKFDPQPDRRLTDRFDAFNTSVNFMAFVNDLLVGTVRLTKDCSLGTPADEYFDFRAHVPDDASVIGVGQFCIREQFRGNLPLLNSLMTMAFYWAISQQGTHLIAPFNPALRALMKRNGFREVSDIITTHGHLQCLPMVGDLNQVRDSFIEFAEKQKIIFFLENFYRTYYQAGEVIIHAGDQADSAYFIVTGKVGVYIGDIEKPETLTLLKELEAGDLFGEVALLKGMRRTAHVIVKDNVQLMVLERKVLLEQIKKEPDKLDFIFELLGSRLGDLIEHQG